MKRSCSFSNPIQFQNLMQNPAAYIVHPKEKLVIAEDVYTMVKNDLGKRSGYGRKETHRLSIH